MTGARSGGEIPSAGSFFIRGSVRALGCVCSERHTTPNVLALRATIWLTIVRGGLCRMECRQSLTQGKRCFPLSLARADAAFARARVQKRKKTRPRCVIHRLPGSRAGPLFSPLLSLVPTTVTAGAVDLQRCCCCWTREDLEVVGLNLDITTARHPPAAPLLLLASCCCASMFVSRTESSSVAPTPQKKGGLGWMPSERFPD